MSTVYKNLGQVAPAANTPTSLYTAPTGATTIVSCICICNQNSTPSTFRIAHRVGGVALASQHYMDYDTPIGPNESLKLVLGKCMQATDILSVSASTSGVSFQADGVETI